MVEAAQQEATFSLARFTELSQICAANGEAIPTD